MLHANRKVRKSSVLIASSMLMVDCGSYSSQQDREDWVHAINGARATANDLNHDIITSSINTPVEIHSNVENYCACPSLLRL